MRELGIEPVFSRLRAPKHPTLMYARLRIARWAAVFPIPRRLLYLIFCAEIRRAQKIGSGGHFFAKPFFVQNSGLHKKCLLGPIFCTTPDYS
jgi:hypothetical protein